MHTFPAATLGPFFQNTSAKTRGAKAIILRASRSFAAGLGLALALSGCSSVRLAYSQAPTLSYYWFNDYLDLTDTQARPFKQDLKSFFNEHRANELPRYAARLAQWQTLAMKNVTPAHACGQFEGAREAYLRGAEQALAPLARVALGLEAAQFAALEKRNAKGNQKFEDEWINAKKDERDVRRFDKALDRYEDLYGSLNTPQRQLLKDLIVQSGYDPSRVMTERQRRQQDLLSSLKQAQAQPEHAEATLRRWHDRVMRSPDPAYATYSQAAIEEGCAQFAAVHNTTNPEQRAHAVKTLKGYESDFRSLMPPL